jgi:cell division protein FtsB
MSEPMTMMAMAGFGLAALGIFLFAALRGWQGWLDLKRLELAAVESRPASHGGMAERIELADLKERIRKLESLAACIDL